MNEARSTDAAALARRGSVVTLAGASFLATAFALVTGPLMARALGPSGRGEVAAATVYATLITLLASLGLPAAVGYSSATKLHAIPALLATTLRYAVWLTLPMIAVAVAITAGPLSDLSPGGRLGAAVMIAIVPVGVLGNCLAAILVSEEALGPLTRLRILPPLLATLCTVAMYVVGNLTVLVALAIGVGTVVWTALLAWRLVRLRPHGRAPFGWMVRFGLRGYPGTLAVFTTHMIDQAVIFAMLGSRPLGFYAVAVTISAIPNSVWLAIYSGYFARVAEEEDRIARGMLISQALRLTLLASVLVSAAIAVASPLLLPVLYGQEFARAVGPLLLLLPGTVVFCASMVGESFLTATGRPGRVTFAELSGLALTLVGLPIVVPRWGIVGAAILSSVSYSVVLAVCVTFLRQGGPVSLRIQRTDLVAFADLARNLSRRVRPGHGVRATPAD
ncbi:MAG: polysaccharide biosynthesis C-terminal domain-containing protein [Acidimicrobiales bacterium]